MNEWISVKDRLPEEYNWVLISYTDATDNNLRFIPSIAEIKNGVWYTRELQAEHKDKYNFEKDCLVKVTHWAPLPRPPRD